VLPIYRVVHKTWSVPIYINHEPYDVILHDGSHIGSEVLIDLEKIHSYLKHDGILITHDTLHSHLGNQMMSAIDDFA